MVEGHVRQGGAGGFQNALDDLQHVAGLRLRIVGEHHVVVLVEGQRARDIDHIVGLHAGEKGASGVPEPAGMTARVVVMGLNLAGKRWGRSGRRRGGNRRRRRPTEEGLDIVERRLLHEVRPCLMGRVFQHDAEIFEVEAVPQGAFHADIGGDAAEDEVADAARPQHAVELRVEEAGIARLRHPDVARLGRQRIHQLIVPAALRQQLAGEFRLAPHGLQRVGLVPVGRAGAAGFHIVRVPAILEEDDLHARRAGDVHRLHALVYGGLGAGNVKAGKVQIAPRRGIGILHVHHHHGRLLYGEGQRLGAGRQGHGAAFSGKAGGDLC